GGIVLNNGTLVGFQQAGQANVLGTGAITVNGGQLSLRTNFGDNAVVAFGNDVAFNANLASTVLDVGGYNKVDTILMGTLNLSPNTLLNLTSIGGTANTVAFAGTGALLTGGSTGLQVFTTANANLALVGGGFSDATRPVNTGYGRVYLGGDNTFTSGTTITLNPTLNSATSGYYGAAQLANTSGAAFGTGQTVTINSGATLPVLVVPNIVNGAVQPVYGTSAPTGFTQGGLAAAFRREFGGSNTSLNSVTNSAQAAGAVVTGAFLGNISDKGFAPPVITNVANAMTNSIFVYSGALKVTTGGIYTFNAPQDDQGRLTIDGVQVTAENTGQSSTGGKGVGLTTTAFGTINLAPGYHSIVYTGHNQGGGGGFQVQYAGPDTAANGIGTNGAMPNAQFIDPSNLLWSTAAPAAGNNYLGAGQINNAVLVPAFATATIDAQGSDLNATFSGLTLGDGSILVTNNQLGNGTIGFTGAINAGLAAMVAPNSGALSLIGGVADNGNGLIKTGSGTLYLGGSSAFTGNLSVGQGALVLNSASALPSGF
ncbi:MAG: hypothetical protein EBR62_08875, partial [Verrucomicrobia bacterium]|nr:hypothetical protein [Verrucomicrobiota bacterium]